MLYKTEDAISSDSENITSSDVGQNIQMGDARIGLTSYSKVAAMFSSVTGCMGIY